MDIVKFSLYLLYDVGPNPPVFVFDDFPDWRKLLE